MQLPIFMPGEDPGPSFKGLLKAIGEWPPSFGESSLAMDSSLAGSIPHATTVLALKCAEGVVMAGDRQATMGYQIGSRTIEKVFPADTHAGVAIAGAAGQAVELVRFFQLSIAHYEKLEGTALSLDGKANMLGQLVRSNFAQAMGNGLFVTPVFAGYDEETGVGRIFEYDLTGGRYEENDFAMAGSGSVHARTAVKLAYSVDQSTEDAIQLAISSLFWAADEDVATGGPDLVRGIYPTVAKISASGYQQVPESEVMGHFDLFMERQGRTALTQQPGNQRPDSAASSAANPPANTAANSAAGATS